jgi:hypothetical protein
MSQNVAQASSNAKGDHLPISDLIYNALRFTDFSRLKQMQEGSP